MAKDPLATLQKLRRLEAQAERRALAERLAAEATAQHRAEDDGRRRRTEPETAEADAERPAKSLKLTIDPQGGSDSDVAARAEVDELNARP